MVELTGASSGACGAWLNCLSALCWCRVTSLKQRVVAVAAANKHTAVLTDAGSIYSWGSNDQGQLGYGTSDSASNAVPRQVEAMKVCFIVLQTQLLGQARSGRE